MKIMKKLLWPWCIMRLLNLISIPAFETVPVLSDIDILALLGQVITPNSDVGGTELSSVLLAAGDMFAQVGSCTAL